MSFCGGTFSWPTIAVTTERLDSRVNIVVLDLLLLALQRLFCLLPCVQSAFPHFLVIL